MKILQSFLGISCVMVYLSSVAFAQSGSNAVEYSKMAEEFRKSQEPGSAVVYDLRRVLDRLDSVYMDCNPCQYDAKMFFRTFGEDSFEIRDFTIRLRQNPNNMSYAHDWEITEHQSEKSVLTMMLINDTAYFIYKTPGEKGMNHFAMREPFEPGSYQWTMHDYFVLVKYLHLSTIDLLILSR